MIKGNRQFNKNILIKNLLCFLLFVLLFSSCSFKVCFTKYETVEYYHYYCFKGTKLKLKETITFFQNGTFIVNRESLDVGGIRLLKKKGVYKQRNQFLILTCLDKDCYFSDRIFFILNRNTLVIKEYGKYHYFKKCYYSNNHQTL